MLSPFVGRSAVERGKSAAIVVLLGLAVLSLQQVSSVRMTATRDQQDRDGATKVVRRFAIALTTYDYAHPAVQARELAAISSSAVSDRIAGAGGDVSAARASSIGDVIGTVIATSTSSRAEVLVRTSQIVSTAYSAAGTKLAGLLDVTVSRTPRGWTVTDYSWLASPGGEP